MEEFDLNDLAQMTGLTTRTLRNYRKRGLLGGTLRGGKYFFTEEEISRFLEQNFVKQSLEIQRNAIVRDYIQAPDPREATGCLIVDVPGEAGESAEIQQKMVQRINSGGFPGLKFSYHYDEKRKSSRFIITGRLEDVRSVTEGIF